MINTLLFLGIALLSGFVIGKFTHNLKITAIVGYIIAGIILGPVLGIVELNQEAVDIVVGITLGLVAFTIGEGFTRDLFRRHGRVIITILIIESLGAFLIVTLGVWLLTRDLVLALIFGSLAPATAPVGTIAALREYKAEGPVTDTLTAIVGLDDAVAVIIFVLCLSAVKVLLGGELSAISTAGEISLEIGGALLLGAAIGAAIAFGARKLRERDDILMVSLAGILACWGIATAFGMSSILACMVLGATVANLRPAIAERTHRIIESILPPIFVIFFIVAGMALEPELLLKMGIVGIIYILCRVLGKVLGTSIGARISRAGPAFRKYLPFGLLSQAGVAIGLACMVATELRGYGEIGQSLGAAAITIIAASTVVFEISGPIGVRYAVTKAGEAKRRKVAIFCRDP